MAANSSPTFSIGSGKVATAVVAGGSEAESVALQGDGKIVVAGAAYDGASDFALVRYNADGSFDTGFGSGGKVTTAIGPLHAVGFSVALQGDGKIVVAGSASNGSDSDFALVRYNADGSLDTGFGTNGKVTTPIGSSQDTAQGVALQGDGKIVVAGFAHNSLEIDFSLARYNTDGSLDTGFGTGGKVTTPIGSPSISLSFGVALQGDGKIVVAGWSDRDFALARYNTDGSPDTGFGTG